MVQITIFSGHDGRLRPGKKFYLTLFAGCDLIRPTVARRILTDRHSGSDGQSSRQGPFFLTIFAGVDIKYPTLAEEFVDFQAMVRSGSLTLGDWDRNIVGLGSTDVTIASFTLFGGFDEDNLPSENEEIDSLAMQRHLGNIPEEHARILELGVGRPAAERMAVLRRTLATPADDTGLERNT